MPEKFDVLVIGSGVGGATFSDYLLRRFPGIKVGIVESGPYLKKERFNQRELDMTRLYFNRGSILSANMEIGVAAACTLGGSSAVYTGVSFRPPESVMEQWRTQYHLDFLTPEFVQTSLDEIEEELGVHELPYDFDNDNNRLFAEGAKHLGLIPKRLKINVKGCKQQGFCNLGCTSGAKQGALEVQIPTLEQRQVPIYCNTEVLEIFEQGVRVYVKPTSIDNNPSYYLKPGIHILKARRIVLAAGAIHTPYLLMKSKRNLSIASPLVGRYLTLHPAYNVHARHPNQLRNYRGFPKTYYIDQFSEHDHYYLETSFYFPGVTAKNQPGFGASHAAFMKDYSRLMSILILQHDEARKENRIALGKKKSLKIKYTMNATSRQSMIKALRMAASIFFEAGCEEALFPATNGEPLKRTDINNLDQRIHQRFMNFAAAPLSSAHPQGGARMGDHSNRAVCDPTGKVFGTGSIYVADASLFPTSVEVNPYETVMLMAKHVAQSIPV
jgi:long-chain-alcohol oxidase